MEYVGLQLMDFIRQHYQITKVIALSRVPEATAASQGPGVAQRYNYYIVKSDDYFTEVVSAIHLLSQKRKIQPRVFIGSTAEKLGIAHVIGENLEREAECTAWDQNYAG